MHRQLLAVTICFLIVSSDCFAQELGPSIFGPTPKKPFIINIPFSVPPELTPVTEDELAKQIGSMLTEMPTTREFLSGSYPIEFRNYERPLGTVAGETVLIASLGTRGTKNTYRELAQRGLPLIKILQIMALQYLPVIAHELQHAHSMPYLKGEHFTVPPEEEEISAYITLFAVDQETRQRYPEAFLYSTTLLREMAISDDGISLFDFWENDGVEGIRAYLRSKSSYWYLRPIDQWSKEQFPFLGEYQAYYKVQLCHGWKLWCDQFPKQCLKHYEQINTCKNLGLPFIIEIPGNR